MMSENFHFIDTSKLKNDPESEGALDENGRLKIFSYSFWMNFTQLEISAFCLKHGIYCVPTAELIDWLKIKINDRKTIEIGSGSGILAKALNIVATDNKMQEWPEIHKKYKSVGQPIIKYGNNVQKLDAKVAIDRLKPKLVVAAWITHKFNAKEPYREGNKYGIDEQKIIKKAEYIHIGNRAVHQFKPALEIPHEELEFPWLVSRAMNGSPNFITIWKKFST